MPPIKLIVCFVLFFASLATIISIISKHDLYKDKLNTSVYVENTLQNSAVTTLSVGVFRQDIQSDVKYQSSTTYLYEALNPIFQEYEKRVPSSGTHDRKCTEKLLSGVGPNQQPVSQYCETLCRTEQVTIPIIIVLHAIPFIVLIYSTISKKYTTKMQLANALCIVSTLALISLLVAITIEFKNNCSQFSGKQYTTLEIQTVLKSSIENCGNTQQICLINNADPNDIVQNITTKNDNIYFELESELEYGEGAMLIWLAVIFAGLSSILIIYIVSMSAREPPSIKTMTYNILYEGM